MSSEARRSLVRIASNYLRLLLTLSLGLILIPLLLGMGKDAFGLITVLGSTVGIASLFQEVVRRGMIRELAAAYHGRDDQAFIHTYNGAMAIALVAGVLAVGIFALIYLFLTWLLRVPEELIPAARGFVVAKAMQSCCVLVLAAPFNMYIVSERMIVYNVLLVMERASYLIAAVLLLTLGLMADPARGVVVYGFVGAGLASLTYLGAAVGMVVIDRRTLPKFWRTNRSAIRAVLNVGAWNAGVVTAMNLHLRMDQFIMNRAYGTLGNAVFGISMQMASYVRMVATGITEGLDAVAARVASRSEEAGVRSLIHQSTRLHGFVTFPAGIALVLLAEPLLSLWIGSRLENADEELPLLVMILQVLAVGIMARSISDGWISVLYGAGHVRRYAPLILMGGTLNPVLAVLLLWLLPEPLRWAGPAAAFSFLMVVLHLGVLPLIGARVLDVSVGRFLMPLVRPLACALLSSPIVIAPVLWLPAWNLLWLAGVIGTYGLAHLAMGLLLVLSADERDRLRDLLRRRAGRKQAPAMTQSLTPPDGIPTDAPSTAIKGGGHAHEPSLQQRSDD